MRNINVILFSSGISEKNGILNEVSNMLSNCGYQCSNWRDLFTSAHESNNIALLPTLIKKIPTFDYAVLIAEGHDKTEIYRDGKIYEEKSMRDNVLFEIGLCAMGLGLSRTILLTNENVRMPEDLTGKNDELAIKRVFYNIQDKESYYLAANEAIQYISQMDKAINEIDEYIQSTVDYLPQIVIGAAASTAIGYVNNYILRMLEQIDKGIEFDNKLHMIPTNKIYLHIIFPVEYTSNIQTRAKEIMEKYKVGFVPHARMRKVEFKYEMIEDELHILDYPTTLPTTYDTAKILLSFDADDEEDPYAEKRFIAKEMDLFEHTLNSLISSKEYIHMIISQYYDTYSSQEKERMISTILDIIQNRTKIERIAY